MLAFCGSCLVLIILTLPETFAPAILTNIAKTKRHETGDDRWYSPNETKKVHWRRKVVDVLATPFVLLFNELILVLVTLYQAFIYAVVYGLFEAYPIIFGPGGHDFNAGIVGLMFIPFFVG